MGCRFLEGSPDSPVRRYTRPGQDIDAVFDLRAVFQQPHRELAIESMPALLLPRKGRYGLRDYEKVFSPDLKSGTDIFVLRGVMAYLNGFYIQQAGTRSGAIGSPEEALVASSDFDYLSTQNRAVVNAMGSLTVGLDRHKLRFTNLFIRDTLKEARIGSGNNFDTVSPSDIRPDATLNTGLTSWYERQLFDTQLVGELKFGDFALDLRGSYAKTKRDAPYERNYSYAFNDSLEDYTNDLRSPGQFASISFSTLDDVLWYGGIDASYRFRGALPVTLSAGYAYSDNERSAVRRDFEYFPNQALNLAIAQERIDYLLSDANVYLFDILLRETTGGLGSAAYDAGLTVNAGYVMGEIRPLQGITVNLGVRYEDGDQSVAPRFLFGEEAPIPTRLKNSYWLPAGLVILQAAFGMWTVTLKLWPQVVTAHLLGGFATLSLLFLLTLRLANALPVLPRISAGLRGLAAMALLLTVGQIAQALRVAFAGVDAGAREKRQRLLEDASLGERERHHAQSSLAMRAPSAPSRASMRS